MALLLTGLYSAQSGLIQRLLNEILYLIVSKIRSVMHAVRPYVTLCPIARRILGKGVSPLIAAPAPIPYSQGDRYDKTGPYSYAESYRPYKT